jgi:hypothetical protein
MIYFRNIYFIIMEGEFIPNRKISELKPYDKNIDVKIILLQLMTRSKLKSDVKMTQFLVADPSGSILCNFFEDVGDALNEGDIIFIKSGYATLFKNNLVLYTPKPGNGQIVKMGEYFMHFNEIPKMSDLLWRKDKDERGQEIFVIDNLK